MKYILVAIGGAVGILLLMGVMIAAGVGVLALGFYFTDSPGGAFIFTVIICVALAGAVGALSWYVEEPEE